MITETADLAFRLKIPVESTGSGSTVPNVPQEGLLIDGIWWNYTTQTLNHAQCPRRSKRNFFAEDASVETNPSSATSTQLSFITLPFLFHDFPHHCLLLCQHSNFEDSLFANFHLISHVTGSSWWQFLDWSLRPARPVTSQSTFVTDRRLSCTNTRDVLHYNGKVRILKSDVHYLQRERCWYFWVIADVFLCCATCDKMTPRKLDIFFPVLDNLQWGKCNK